MVGFLNKKRLLSILVLLSIATISFSQENNIENYKDIETFTWMTPYSDILNTGKHCVCSLVWYKTFDSCRFYYRTDYYQFSEADALNMCRAIMEREFLKSHGYYKYHIQPTPNRKAEKNTSSTFQVWEAKILLIK